MKIFYVYCYRDPETNLVRYVGKGSKDRAIKRNPYNRYSECRKWILDLREKGLKPKIDFLKKDLSEEMALDFEKEFIRIFRLQGMPLTNLTEGGVGTSGYKFSEEQKKKNGSHHIGNSYRKGIPHTEETKNKIREARSRQIVWNTGLKGIPGRHKTKVIDTASGQVWDSISEAASEIGINHKTLSNQLSGHRKNKTTLIRAE